MNPYVCTACGQSGSPTFDTLAGHLCMDGAACLARQQRAARPRCTGDLGLGGFHLRCRSEASGTCAVCGEPKCIACLLGDECLECVSEQPEPMEAGR